MLLCNLIIALYTTSNNTERMIKVTAVTHLNMFRLLVVSMGTRSCWCGRKVDAPGIRSRSLFTMSVAMRSDVNGLMAATAAAAATAAGTFFSSDDGVDDVLGHDGVDDADDDEALPAETLTLLLLLLALRSSGWSSDWCC